MRKPPMIPNQLIHHNPSQRRNDFIFALGQRGPI
jgi:hypothetical protein